MGHPRSTDSLPSSVKLAAALLVVYGAAVVLNATVIQEAGGWAAPRDFPRALIRLLGTGLIAWGLVQRARWAWWVGVILAAFWLVAGAAAVLVVERGDVYWLQPSGFQVFLMVSLLCLGLALGLLLSPSARRVFRRPASSPAPQPTGPGGPKLGGGETSGSL
jgi:peptidoglycan/LPS O-acetylase OafA/YrhL